MNNTIYPEDYTDEDKAVYDDLMARGELLIGKKIAKSDAFLIEMAVKMTINQMKGYVSPDTPEVRHKEYIYLTLLRILVLNLLLFDYIKNGHYICLLLKPVS